MNLRSVVRLTAQVFGRLSSAMWIPALLTRLFVGYFFFTSGWAKVHDLAFAGTTRNLSVGSGVN